MKAYILIILTSFILQACHDKSERCKEDGKHGNLTDEQLKWVKVDSSKHTFKRITIDNLGQPHIDTIQGEYVVSSKSEKYANDDCYVEYQSAKNVLTTTVSGFYSSISLSINNFPVNGLEMTLQLSGRFSEPTQTDTAFVNGKLYTNVYKLHPNHVDEDYYFIKGTGYILIKDNYNYWIELIK